MPMQYTEIFKFSVEKKMIFFLFLLSTHNLCFGAKIRIIGIPLHTPVLLYKSGVPYEEVCHGHVFLLKIIVVVPYRHSIRETLSNCGPWSMYIIRVYSRR